MSDVLEQVLRLVAEGRLTAEEAAPILAALDAATGTRSAPAEPGAPDVAGGRGGRGDRGNPPRYARIQVSEADRPVVDLRIPISLGRFALAQVPGISAEHLADVEAAIAAGTHGPILQVRDADGDSVRIELE